MTRKDYIAIARVLSSIEDNKIRMCTGQIMSDMLGQDNPRFNRIVFLAKIEQQHKNN